MRRRIVLFFLFLAAGFEANAQETTLTASVSKNPVATGEQFEVTFTANASVNGFQAPSFKDFVVLGGPNQSTSMQFINGTMSQSVSFSYYLQAKAEGTFRIDAATVNAGGKRIQSNPISINVIKGSAKQQSQQGSTGNEDSDLALLSQNVFIKALVNKTNLYKGEAISITFRLYTRVNVMNFSLTKLPPFTGFWTQDIKMPEQLQLRNETINGINYRVSDVKKVIVFPQQSGTLKIEPMEGECLAHVQIKSKKSQNDPWGIFNDPFGLGSLRDIPVKVKSDPITIIVKDLPPASDPAFTGSVGKFSMEASIDKSTVTANDGVNLKIKIAGSGNLKLIQAPEITIPPDIEKYEAKVNDNLSVTERGVSGAKTFEFLLVPRQQGNYTIDPVHFTYFDIDKKQYIKLQSGSFNLKVLKGSGFDAGAAVAVQNKSDFKLIGKDIRFIKTKFLSDPLNKSGFFGSWKYYGLLFSSVLAVAAAAIYKRRTAALNRNLALVKSRKATRIALKRLAVSKKLLDQKKLVVFYEEVFKALYGYSGDKLSIAQAELSKDKLKEILLSKSVKEETVNNLISTINFCEFARFATGGSTVDPQKIYSDSVQIITNLENELA